MPMTTKSSSTKQEYKTRTGTSPSFLRECCFNAKHLRTREDNWTGNGLDYLVVDNPLLDGDNLMLL